MFVRISVSLIVVLILFVCYVRYLEKVSLFAPSKAMTMAPDTIGLSFENINFRTEDKQELHGWFIPSEKTRTVLLVCHGNAGNIADRLGKIENFHNLGLSVFIFDYRGYGKSSGYPTEKGMYRDTVAAFDYLVQQKNIDPNNIVIYGASLGGAAAVDAAGKRNPKALIIDSSFSSAVDIGKHYYPFIPSFLVSIKLNSAAKITELKIPVLFFHSSQDEVIPYVLGQKLFEAANEPKTFITLEGGHNDGHAYDQDKFVGGIANFLQQNDLLKEKE